MTGEQNTFVCESRRLVTHCAPSRRDEKYYAEKAERDAARKAIMRETAGEPYHKEVRIASTLRLGVLFTLRITLRTLVDSHRICPTPHCHYPVLC